jgi:hypothetical protein
MFKIYHKKKFGEEFFQHFGVYLIRISKVIFNVSSLSSIGFFIMEYLKTGLISNYFDLNIWLVIALISGLLVIFFSENERKSKDFSYNNWIIYLIPLIAGLLTYQYLQNFGFLSYLITLLVVLMGYISLFLFFNNEQDYD